MIGSENGPTDRQPTAFISHHSSQVETARRLKVILGHHEITGWMAPDDIDPGQPFDKAIVDQVRQSDLIILLFCGQSDQSRHVKRELMMAEDADKLIFPVRLEDKAADGLAYWLNDYQWIDWFDGEDDTIVRMIDTIKRQAGSDQAGNRNSPGAAPPSLVSQTPPNAAIPAPVRQGSQWMAPIVTAVIVGLVMLAGLYFMTRDDDSDEPSQTAAADAVGEPAELAIETDGNADFDPVDAPATDTDPVPVASTVDGGNFYVVVGSFQPNDPSAGLRAREFESCAGIRPIVGRSDDYTGFAPGLTVVMTGGYPDASAANEALVQARACVADAYLRSTE